MTELSEPTQELQASLRQEVLLHRITNQIRQSLDLQEVLATAVTEVRLFLQTDRVMVYQFHANGSGFVVAESVRKLHLLPLLGLNFPVDDIPAEARELFLKARQRSIIDVAEQKIGLSPLDCPETGEPLARVEIGYRPAAPCHLQYLSAMGVQFSLVVPLVCQHAQTGQAKSELWGLLVAHHVAPRAISEQELTVVQRVADQVAIAIAQAALYRQMQAKAEREAIVNHTTALLHASPEIHFQVALEAVVERLEGAGGRLFIYGEGLNQLTGLYTCGHQPGYPDEKDVLIEAHPLWQACAGIGSTSVDTAASTEQSCGVCAIPDLYQTASLHPIGPAFRNSPIRSLLIVPLYCRQSLLGFLSVFRTAISVETWWAGRFNSSQQQLQPRQSFHAWKELKQGQVHSWSQADIELAQALSTPFSLAIQQYHLYAQVQRTNTDLEHQVQERTAELRQSLDNLKQTQTQLIQTEKMSSLGQLVAGVAHEINNPVNFIYGNLHHVIYYVQALMETLQLYEQCYPNSDSRVLKQAGEIDLEFLLEDLPKTLTSMQVGAERIRQIILSLRNFSRLDEAEMKAVDIHEGIDSTLLILQHRLKAGPNRAEIQIVREYGDLPLVECYAGQLNQVFMNLLANAIDALEESMEQKEEKIGQEAPKPVIQIYTKVLDGKGILIRIVDNGPGIPEAVQSHIFDPFFTTKPIKKGTGLGLAISYQIMEKHGGTLQCSSIPGQGTEFWLELPVSSPLQLLLAS